MPLSLRPGRLTDLPGIAAMMNLAFRGEGEDAGWNSEADLIRGDRTSQAALAEELSANPAAMLLVAEDSSSMIGSVRLEPLSAETWYLGGLTVDPRRQNSGLGRQLLAAAEQWAIAAHARSIQITVVNRRESLIAWYRRRGYQLTGEIRPFPYDDNRFGTPLRGDLCFVVLEKTLQGEPGTA